MLNEQSAGCMETTFRLKAGCWPGPKLACVAKRLSTIECQEQEGGVEPPDPLLAADGRGAGLELLPAPGAAACMAEGRHGPLPPEAEASCALTPAPPP